jgi:hypothetical protein
MGLGDGPLRRQERVVRNPARVDDRVELRVADARVGTKEGKNTTHVAAAEPQDVGAERPIRATTSAPSPRSSAGAPL